MFRRKLKALEYPVMESFDVNDDKKFRNLVVWLEDQKIRHYQMEEREPLRNTVSATWETTFQQYIKDIDMCLPIENPKRAEIIDWMLGFAVRLEYGDNAEKYNKASAENIKLEKETQQQGPQIVAANPLDKLDFSSPEFVEGVNALADKLDICKHPNHLITLEAVAKVIKTHYSKEAIQRRKNNSEVQGTPYPLQEMDIGFDMGDYVLNNAAKVLRLLYIHDLRDLQTKINECIVAVQTITANPKTDTRLGKVGF